MLSQIQSLDLEAEEADSEPLLLAWEGGAQCSNWGAGQVLTPESPLWGFSSPLLLSAPLARFHQVVDFEEEEPPMAPQLHLQAPQGLPSLIGMFPLLGVRDGRGC